MMYNNKSPDKIMRTASLVTAGASNMLKRTNTLVNGYWTPSTFQHSYGWGSDNDNVNDNDIVSVQPRNGLTDKQSEEDQTKSDVSYEKHINKITKVLSKKGGDDLKELYNKNEKLSDDLVNYIRDKLALRKDQILDKKVYQYYF